jgi:hypothetical protein
MVRRGDAGGLSARVTKIDVELSHCIEGRDGIEC